MRSGSHDRQPGGPAPVLFRVCCRLDLGDDGREVQRVDAGVRCGPTSLTRTRTSDRTWDDVVGPVLRFLDPDDFPTLYRSADRTSLGAQRRFLVVLRVRLGGLLVATVGAAVTWELGSFQVGGLVSLLAFAIALAAELYIATAQPDRAWYEGRASAESA